MALSSQQVHDLCSLAIAEARKSIREDERPHPMVGAVLVDDAGSVLDTSYRGETPKRHAEFTLLEKAAARGVDLGTCTLFVTLEPCIRRGKDKVPCAVRVAAAGIRKVYIGTLDPDPGITGRGEMYLTYEGVSVEHFPGELADGLRAENKEFFDRFRAAHFWDPPAPSLYGTDDTTSSVKPMAARTREGILYQTLDLICGSQGPIWISAGDLSWLRELQVSLIGAAFDRREMRLIQHPRDSRGSLASVAVHLGLSVVERTPPGGMRFTVVGPRTASAAAIVIEQSHALLLRLPDEAGLIELVSDWFVGNWAGERSAPAQSVNIREIPFEAIVSALQKYVPQYKNLSIGLAEVNINSLKPASRKLESFKLFRIHQFAALRTKHELPEFAAVVGSPWPLIAAPVVEQLPDGSMVLIDGTHRAYSARARGENTIRAIVVENPNFDLPSQPAPSWSEVDILPSKLPREHRYAKFDPKLFRPIRVAFESLTL